MSLILNFIRDMSLYMIISLPIFIFIRYIVYLKTKKFNLKKEILLLIFAMFLVSLASQTILPKYDENNNLIVSDVRLNLIPFKIFYDSYIEFQKGNIYYLIISLIGNIIMFIPIGFLIKSIWNLDNKKIILIGFLISLSIESIQIFIGRQTDIDDIILNVFGVYLGIKLKCKL